MSALSLATLGVICEDRALSMASLGVFCGIVLTIIPKKAPDAGGYTVEMDEMEVLDLCSIIIASGVLDGDS